MSRAQELLERPTTTRVDRRRFLQFAGALAGSALFSQLRPDLAGGSPRLSGYPFQLGVASGDPLPHGVVLWTRLAPVAFEPNGGMPQVRVPVGWRIAKDEGMRQVVRRGNASPFPSLPTPPMSRYTDWSPGATTTTSSTTATT